MGAQNRRQASGGGRGLEKGVCGSLQGRQFGDRRMGLWFLEKRDGGLLLSVVVFYFC